MSVTIAEIANSIYESVNAKKDDALKENKLLSYLYRSYCRLEAKDFGQYESAANEQRGNAFYFYQPYVKELFQWYTNRYHKGFHMPMGSPGGNRTVDSQQNPDKKTSYRFSELYGETTFLHYLTGEYRTESTRARDFILHVSVAFLLSPTQVDELLSFYGFAPLHVRNIHHLSIYAILDAFSHSEKMDENPFDKIQVLYEQACKILSTSEGGQNDDGAFLMNQRMILEKNSTRYIQGYLFGEHVLCKENMLRFIQENADVFDRRHHRLLAEHRKCAALFTKLYDTKGDDHWGEEPKYNLYQFLSGLCLNMERNHYLEYLLSWIMKKNRHPTREIMIVLWMYSYCFLFMPEIIVPVAFLELDPLKEYTEYVSSNEDYRFQHKPFHDYMDLIGKGQAAKGRLHVLQYLADSSDKASPLPQFCGQDFAALNFEGTTMIAFLNFKLREYNWPQLDGKKAFDQVILQLQPLEIHLNTPDSMRQATYYGKSIKWENQMNIDNIPIPLVLITQILLSLKEKLGGGFPLDCNLYEYI